MIVEIPRPCHASATTNATSACSAIDPDVGAVRNDRVVRSRSGDKRVAIGVVDIDRPVGNPIEVGDAEEADHQRRRSRSPRRTRGAPPVARLHRPDVDARAVTERNIDDIGDGICGRLRHWQLDHRPSAFIAVSRQVELRFGPSGTDRLPAVPTRAHSEGKHADAGQTLEPETIARQGLRRSWCRSYTFTKFARKHRCQCSFTLTTPAFIVHNRAALELVCVGWIPSRPRATPNIYAS